jgi:hypothetical protein
MGYDIILAIIHLAELQQIILALPEEITYNQDEGSGG